MAFPTTSLLDNFNRTNANPLDGNWLIAPGGASPEIVSNHLECANSPPASGSTFWNVMQQADSEVWVKSITLPSTDELIVYTRANNYNNTCYEAAISRAGGGAYLGRRDNGNWYQLAFTSYTFQDGDGVGLSTISDLITMYLFRGGVWTQLLQVTDATYTRPGYVGFGFFTQADGLQWDDFGGGAAASYVSEVLADNPVAYYRMDETSGQPQDASGNGNHTTVTNGTPVYSQPGALGSDPPSTSIYQDGAVSFVCFTAPDHASLDVGDVFSAECWMKRTRSGAFEEAWLTKGVNSFFCSIKNDRLHLAQQDVASIAESTVTITDTAWHHLVITKNGSTVKLYVDGVDVTGTVTNQTLTNTTAVLATGNGTYPIDAYIDEAAIYPTALSAERIRAHYRAGKYYRPSTNKVVR